MKWSAVSHRNHDEKKQLLYDSMPAQKLKLTLKVSKNWLSSLKKNVAGSYLFFDWHFFSPANITSPVAIYFSVVMR